MKKGGGNSILDFRGLWLWVYYIEISIINEQKEEEYVILIEKDNDIYEKINTEFEDHVDSINSENFDNKGVIKYFLKYEYKVQRRLNNYDDKNMIYNLLTSFFDKNNICVFYINLMTKTHQMIYQMLKNIKFNV